MSSRRVSYDADWRRGSLDSGRFVLPRIGLLERRGSLPPPRRGSICRLERRGSLGQAERRGSFDRRESSASLPNQKFGSGTLGDLDHSSYSEEFNFNTYLEEEALLEERSRRGLYPILESSRPADVAVTMEDTGDALELELKNGTPVALVVDDGEYGFTESVGTPSMESLKLIMEEESGDEAFAYDNVGYDGL